MKRTQVILTTLAFLTLGGCTTYYKVHDPSTGKTYYTTEVAERGTGVQMIDARTGDKVTIQNSEVSKVTKEEFDTARSQK